MHTWLTNLFGFIFKKKYPIRIFFDTFVFRNSYLFHGYYEINKNNVNNMSFKESIRAFKERVETFLIIKFLLHNSWQWWFNLEDLNFYSDTNLDAKISKNLQRDEKGSLVYEIAAISILNFLATYGFIRLYTSRTVLKELSSTNRKQPYIETNKGKMRNSLLDLQLVKFLDDIPSKQDQFISAKLKSREKVIEDTLFKEIKLKKVINPNSNRDNLDIYHLITAQNFDMDYFIADKKFVNNIRSKGQYHRIREELRDKPILVSEVIQKVISK